MQFLKICYYLKLHIARMAAPNYTSGLVHICTRPEFLSCTVYFINACIQEAYMQYSLEHKGLILYKFLH